MDSQLSWLLELLEEHKINYWLDSGTLLGLARDGRLLEADHDLDIGCFVDEADKVLELIDIFRERDYTMARELFADQPGKYFFSNRLNDATRSIDFKFYRQTGDHCWTPQISLTSKRSDPSNLLKYLYSEMVRQSTIELREDFSENYQTIHSYRWPFNKAYDAATWIFPARHFKNTEQVKLAGREVHVPADYQDYLQYRYGAWEQTKKDWEYWWDDRGLNHVSPYTVKNWQPNDVPAQPVKKERKVETAKFSLPGDHDRWLIIKTSGRTYRKLTENLNTNNTPDQLDVLVMSESGQAIDPPLENSQIYTFPGNRFQPEEISEDCLQKINAADYDAGLLLYNNITDSSYRTAENAFAKFPISHKYVLDEGGFRRPFNSLSFRFLQRLRPLLNLSQTLLSKMIYFSLSHVS